MAEILLLSPTKKKNTTVGEKGNTGSRYFPKGMKRAHAQKALPQEPMAKYKNTNARCQTTLESETPHLCLSPDTSGCDNKKI